MDKPDQTAGQQTAVAARASGELPTDNAPGPTSAVPEGGGPPVGGYAHSATVWVSPRILRWVVPGAAAAIFVLLFLPWTGAFPGGYRVYTQNAFQTIWGGV